MAKRYQLVDTQQPGPSKEVQAEVIDWSKCVLCQIITKEPLQCPGESVRQDSGNGYVTLAKNLLGFNEIHEMPMDVDLTRLNDGDGIESTFRKHKARWHKSCNLKFNTTKLKRAEKKRKSSENAAESECGKKSRSSTRLSLPTNECDKDICFFCGEKSGSEPLRLAATFGVDSHVRKCALELQDERLLTKLSGGDMVAQDAKYHVRCLVSLYNRARACKDKTKLEKSSDEVLHGIALAELIAYIDEAQSDEVSPVFRLADLLALYSARLKKLGLEKQGRIHSTRLKERILAHLPGIRAHTEGRDVLLAFDTDVGLALRKACEKDSDDEAMCLAAAANIVRRDMFQQQSVFTGSFDPECQVKSVPQSLLSLVSMVLNGPNIKSSDGEGLSQATLSIAQLMQYNSSVRKRSAENKTTYHHTSRETPLPIYTALTIHSKTRKRKLVDKMSELGLSISYDRLMDISTDMGNRVCEQYCRENMVCPPNLRKGLFTTAAVDNIDHNPSSTTASEAFHGTGISLFQHPDTQDGGVDRREHRILKGQTTLKTKFELPESYTSVMSVGLKKSDVPIPDTEGHVKGAQPEMMEAALDEENRFVF